MQGSVRSRRAAALDLEQAALSPRPRAKWDGAAAAKAALRGGRQTMSKSIDRSTIPAISAATARPSSGLPRTRKTAAAAAAAATKTKKNQQKQQDHSAAQGAYMASGVPEVDGPKLLVQPANPGAVLRAKEWSSAGGSRRGAEMARIAYLPDPVYRQSRHNYPSPHIANR